MSVMRTALIALSRNKALQDLIVRVPISRKMARRFVSGETLDEALDAVRELNRAGMIATLDHLGENVASQAEAVAAADEYMVLLDAIDESGVKSNVSVKLTQMGLDLGDDFCYDNVRRIVHRAQQLGNFVRVDMEGSDYTTRTLAIYRRLRGEFDNTGVVVQAYLHRTQSDVEGLIADGMGHFRLCKGAYDESETIAYRERPRVTQAMQDLISTGFTPESRARGAFMAIASHDEDVINFARAYTYQHGIAAGEVEFQMLYGIRRELQHALVKQGHVMRIYVPYGTHWYPYFMRRLAERPANLFFFLRALVGD